MIHALLNLESGGDVKVLLHVSAQDLGYTHCPGIRRGLRLPQLPLHPDINNNNNNDNDNNDDNDDNDNNDNNNNVNAFQLVLS